MPRKPHKFSRAQITAINRGKYWATKWRLMPGQMERARTKATKESVRERERQRLNIKDDLIRWPARMTPKDFNEQVAGYVPKGYNPKSFVNRLRRYGFFTFDLVQGLWVNQCRPSGQPADPLAGF
jgi:hypothetical protein